MHEFNLVDSLLSLKLSDSMRDGLRYNLSKKNTSAKIIGIVVAADGEILIRSNSGGCFIHQNCLLAYWLAHLKIFKLSKI